MTLRSKLLVAQLPLVLALAAAAIAGSLVARSLGQSSREILKDNYRSVLAAQRMKESAERIDSGVLFMLAGRAAEGWPLVATHRRRFEEELRTQEGNITERGELEATRRLRASWEEYQRGLDAAVGPERPETRDATPPVTADGYFATVLPAFTRLKRDAEVILDTNQDAMLRKSDRAEAAAKRFNTLLLAIAIGGCVFAILAATALTTRFLRPLTVLGHVARRIGAGELDARARLPGKDEIAALARELDTMAERLEKYRKSSLGELLEAQQAAQAAMDSLPDPILVVGVDGRLDQVNRAAEDVLGVNLETPGRDALSALDPAVRAVVETVRQHVLSGKGPYAPKGLEEAFRLAAAGGDRHFLPRATPVYSAEGAVAGTTVVLQEVTRLLRFDELKNNLVATVAHEFRTPLTSLRMAIHLCVEQAIGPLTEKQADVLYAARDDCERLQSTVDELLDLSRIQAGRMELRRVPIDIEAFVNEAIEGQRSFATQAGIDLRAELLPGMGSFAGDPDRLHLVIGNLLSNAIRHSRPRGAVRGRALVADGRVRFEVSDDGAGIPDEYHEAIFDKYFRLPGESSGGAGLGLFIAREIVQEHGGDIGVVSEPGKGSTFWFTVPIARPGV